LPDFLLFLLDFLDFFGFFVPFNAAVAVLPDADETLFFLLPSINE